MLGGWWKWELLHWENFFFFLNAICLHDTKEKPKEIQRLHLVCKDLSPLLISDPAVSITQTQKLGARQDVLGDSYPLQCGGRERSWEENFSNKTNFLCALADKGLTGHQVQFPARGLIAARQGSSWGRQGCYWGPHFSKTCQIASPLNVFDIGIGSVSQIQMTRTLLTCPLAGIL